MNRIWQLLPVLILAKGCSFFKPDEYRPNSPDVNQVVKKLQLPETQAQPLEDASVVDLIARLEAVKAGSERSEEQFQVGRRLAQLRLQAVENQLVEGVTDIDFETPIAELQALQKFTEAEEGAAEIAYQLARMQEMKGAADSVLVSLSNLIALGNDDPASLEARFRRAEIFFSRGDFAAAAADYGLVAGVAGQYQLHARYMLTWVQFKQGDLDSALATSISAFQQISDQGEITQNELKQDLLRVTVIALDYLEGPTSLATLMAAENKPAWQSELYRALGDWYLSKSRFADSAETWETFLKENPLHQDAPKIAQQVIATQREAGFVELIPALQVSFIQRYGKQSEFFELHGEPVFQSYQDELKVMLDRYTQQVHATAQQTRRVTDYRAAADVYGVWLANFEQHAEAQEKRLLYAEALQAADDLPAALDQYEAVVAEDAVTDFAREAAYAVVLTRKQLANDTEAEIAANIRFATLYPDDPRAPVCQLKAADLLFTAAQYARALPVAQRAIEFSLSPADIETATKIVGHSAFQIDEFALAAKQYRSLLARHEDSDVRQRLLAAVFKQGEQAELAGDLDQAIEFYASLSSIDARAELSRDAQYDIATIYEQLGEDKAAIQQLEKFRQQFTDHGEAIAQRLVQLYERSGNLEAAATELLASAPAGNKARLARYRAAELFLEAGNLELAIEHFRHYAHNYPEPADLRLEAMHHMDLLYQQTGENQKRKFWLRQKRDAYRSLAKLEQTDRVKFLAAEANYILAEDQYEAFKAARLDQPLARSLKNKQKLLAECLKRYEETAAIGVLAFVTRSNFQMANLYQILATDLMASEPPGNLNALEQDQYVLLLEEQAYPFEEQAIMLHQRNLQLGWQASWDEAVNHSLLALQRLSPGRYMRRETEVDYVNSD